MSKNSFNTRRFCSVLQCSNRPSDTISLHYFPFMDKKLCREWQVALKIGKPITKWMCVCSEHFLESDFFRGNSSSKIKRKRLKKNVIPSQKIPVLSHSIKINTKNRDRAWLNTSMDCDIEMTKNDYLTQAKNTEVKSSSAVNVLKDTEFATTSS